VFFQRTGNLQFRHNQTLHSINFNNQQKPNNSKKILLFIRSSNLNLITMRLISPMQIETVQVLEEWLFLVYN